MAGSNGRADGSFQLEFQRVTEEEVSFALRVLTTEYGKRPALLSQQDIRDITHKGKSSVSNWVNDGVLPVVAFIQIAQEAARLGDFALIELVIPQNYTLQPATGGQTNGDCTDEECEIVGSADRVRQHFDTKDRKGARRELASLKKHVASMEEEINQL